LREVNSLGFALAARGRSPPGAGSPNRLTAPQRSSPAHRPGPAPAPPKRSEAALRALPESKLAASCNRTRHTRALHAPPTDSVCPLRLLICRQACVAAAAPNFSPITPLGPEMQRPPRGAVFHERRGVLSFHSIPDESRLPRERRKPAKPRPHTQSAISAHADDSEDA
jgi:hypothetical protein